MNRDDWNGSRYQRQEQGHYESWFQRANHPTRPLAFWIRYTIFSPKGRPEDAVGELWAIYFDGETNQHVAIKQVVPIDRCAFSRKGLDHSIDESRLDSSRLEGEARGQGHEIRWSLSYRSPAPPLLLLPEPLYRGSFPKAKSLVGSPLAVFSGSLEVNGERIEIEEWVGSQNHNWGERHTDRYAWGQVAGFDDAPDAFLEIGTARLKLGPLWSPWMTVMVLRLGEEEIRLTGIPQSLRARGRYDYFCWRFASSLGGTSITGAITATRNDFVGLPYDNPPGGVKTCLNSKIASCHLTLRRRGRHPLVLHTSGRAAFEILTDDRDHMVPIICG